MRIQPLLAAPRISATVAAPAPAGPRDSVVPSRQGPPDLAEIQGEFALRSRELSAAVRQGLPECDARTAAALAKVENLAAALGPQDSAAVKSRLREAIWELRQALEAGPPAGQAAPIRKSLEDLRTASLDHSFERSLGGYPMERHVIRPRVSDVPNFDQVTPGVLRGGQPDQEGADWLLARGVDAVIDLRGDDGDNQWVAPTWGPVQRYAIPLKDYGTPSLEQVEEFGRLLRERAEAGEQVFVHCKAGIGRTGVMVACWRVTQGWTAEEAVARERFLSPGGSFRQEQFVRDFEQAWKARG